MATLVDYPGLLFITLFVLFVVAAALGAFVLRRFVKLSPEERDDFNLVQTSTLTLLALLIGFSLSMAVSRYDQRKNLEESEANAIGTEYVRADLAGAPLAAQMKTDLVSYTKLRIADFKTRNPQALAQIGRDTVALQARLWQSATQVAKDKPTPIGSIIVTGMNDVLNSQDYSEAARINRLPVGAWCLMIAIAFGGCVVQGFGAKGNVRRGLLIIILPATVSLSLSLIADIDSPRGGIIRIEPQNLTRLMQSFGG
jgi:hypothetical protein